ALGLGLKLEFTAAAPAYGSPTASLNDVLRLTGTAPFTSSFSSANAVNVYLAVTSVSAGSTFEGGIFTDLASDFLASISGATKNYYVLGNGLGTDATLGTQGYYLLSNYDASLSFDLTTIARTADFGAGNVNGEVMLFTAVPEPSTIGLALLGGSLAAIAARRRRNG
ncbi:MAG: PEP-CTERM sorting domain-containing protein, partial [Planctomycetota bacterium]